MPDGGDVVSTPLYQAKAEFFKSRVTRLGSGSSSCSHANATLAELVDLSRGQLASSRARRVAPSADLWVSGQKVSPIDFPPTFARVRDSSLHGPLRGQLAAMSADTLLTSNVKKPAPR